MYTVYKYFNKYYTNDILNLDSIISIFFNKLLLKLVHHSLCTSQVVIGFEQRVSLYDMKYVTVRLFSAKRRKWLLSRRRQKNGEK